MISDRRRRQAKPREQTRPATDRDHDYMSGYCNTISSTDAVTVGPFSEFSAVERQFFYFFIFD